MRHCPPMRAATLLDAAAAATVVAIAVLRARCKPADHWEPLRNVKLSTLSAIEFWRLLDTAICPPEAERRALSFVPRAGDVVTITTPKTGQTWLLAQLRKLSLGMVATDDSALAVKVSSDGDGVCWLEHGQSGRSADAPQPGRFRVFKSHLPIQKMRAVKN